MTVQMKRTLPPYQSHGLSGTVIKGEPFAGSSNIEFSGRSEFITASQGNKSRHHDSSSHTYLYCAFSISS
ncbi:hypothetical protein BT96DRAFT_110108 [Gymnopus androsaceus JB14]|uniref:Uncharacterized protein n=1 Tax=Gymnopus androsaceus JB14 TaxID=1447944 RepID=A0A6A4HI29_9AGAR|nr:hypothetical protein BT96DRAFT_110108 [Gymnopus androsaceus JB14]